MRDVYVIGIGITSFTRLEYPLSEIAAYPAMMAMKDAGTRDIDHLYDAITIGNADAVLMASITHFQNYTINQIKQYLKDRGIPVNL